MKCVAKKDNGSASVQFTDLETEVPGTYFGQFIVDYRRQNTDTYFGDGYFSYEYFNEYIGWFTSSEYESFADEYFGDGFFSDQFFSGYFSGVDQEIQTAVCTFPSDGYIIIKINKSVRP